jgi:hypothetical protein
MGSVKSKIVASVLLGGSKWPHSSVWSFTFIGLLSLGVALGAGLDTQKIHDTYLEGDIDKARKTLEDYRTKTSEPSFGERIFIAKYLGVIYAASPSTHEKARELFRELLALDSGAKIVDMYPSDEIMKLFRSVEEESLANINTASDSLPLSTSPATSSGSIQNTRQSSGKSSDPNLASRFKNIKPVWWATAGLGTVAIVTTWIFLASDEEEPEWTVVSGVSP